MERSDFKVHESPRLEEKYYEITHRSGLRIYIHPKDFSNTVAMLTVLFGSSDREFVDGSGGRVEVPAGSAHFLEHKMFETEDGEDIFYVFSQYGANSNAFTSNEITSYYFSCTDCFRESLGTLLGFVLDPHFTRESVEKEKDIIRQEIRSGEDSPKNRIYYELLRLMYFSPAFSDTVCGAESDIDSIDADALALCQRTFYRPDNMVLTVCGRVAPEEVLSIVDEHLGDLAASGDAVRRVQPNEPMENRCDFSEIRMDVSRPLFAFGIKDSISSLDERCRLKRRIAVNLLLDATFGHSGEFFSQNYKRGVLTNNFAAEYEMFTDHAFVMVSGESDSIEVLRSAFFEKIGYLASEGISEEDFTRMRRSAYADSVTGFDSPDVIAENLIECAVTGNRLFDPSDTIPEITYEYVREVASEVFDPGRIACALVLPLED